MIVKRLLSRVFLIPFFHRASALNRLLLSFIACAPPILESSAHLALLEYCFDEKDEEHQNVGRCSID